MSTTVKLGIASCIVGVVTAYMAYLGMSTSWQYYMTVDECLANAPALVKQRVRVNGKVAMNSLVIAEGRYRATFMLCGTDGNLPVRCAGILPDNLAEEMDVVVEGHLDETGLLHCDKVITRCASKYESGPATLSSAPSQASPEVRR